MGYGSPPARWGMPRAMGYPRMLEVRQRFDAPRVDDVAGTVAAELARIGVRGRIQPGATVAIGVGSRGITNLALVVRTLVGVLKEVGARPFVVPAMGSHGGATVEGQRAILAGYGITEDGIGAPIRASMETVDLGATDGGIPIHFDRTALEADHVAIVNRVKPHTNFAGEIESGLLKMTVIGFGKHTGAARSPSASPWSRTATTRPRSSRPSPPPPLPNATRRSSCSPSAGCRGSRSTAPTS